MSWIDGASRLAIGTPRVRMPTSASSSTPDGIALEDLVRDARERPAHPIGVHHDRHGQTSEEIG